MKNSMQTVAVKRLFVLCVIVDEKIYVKYGFLQPQFIVIFKIFSKPFYLQRLCRTELF